MGNQKLGCGDWPPRSATLCCKSAPLHALSVGRACQPAVVPHLTTAGRRVVTLDFLGYGASDKPRGASYSFERQKEDVEAVVEALHLDKIVPVGHDAGGPAAINFAIDHPDRTSSLCLLNTFYSATPAIRLPELIEIFANPSLSRRVRGLALKKS
jgi:haloalkane dehalogenase